MTEKLQEITIISFTRNGAAENRRLCGKFLEQGYVCNGFVPERFSDLQNADGDSEGAGEHQKTALHPLPEETEQWIGEKWGKSAFVFIGAAGIAVRCISPWVKDKYTDSPVVVMDEMCRYVFPVLSGHVGGAVKLAEKIADLTGASAVHTTATDVQKKFAVDVFAENNDLLLTDRKKAKLISAAVLDGEQIGVFVSDPWIRINGKLSEQLSICKDIKEIKKYTYRIFISQRLPEEEDQNGATVTLCLLPRNVVVGIGCRKGAAPASVQESVEEFMTQNRLLPEQISCISSIDLKKEEEALMLLAEKYKVPFVTFPACRLAEIQTVTAHSAFVEKVTGVDNVCERAAACVCQDGIALAGKTVKNAVTVAAYAKPENIYFDSGQAECGEFTEKESHTRKEKPQAGQERRPARSGEILIFAGTTEGRKLAEFAAENEIPCSVSTATEYGADIMKHIHGVKVLSGRMDTGQIRRYLRRNRPRLVIDATHPFAVKATENIRNACRLEKTACIRCVRERNSSKSDDIKKGQVETDSGSVMVPSVEAAAEFLKNREGNILIATGSKDLKEYVKIPDYRNRCFARVLSTEDAVKEGVRLGFEGRHLIAMQGPFSTEINLAMLRHVNASWFVTKESGKTGGYDEKAEAARMAGAVLVTVKRPEEDGKSLEEIRNLIKHMKIPCQ